MKKIFIGVIILLVIGIGVFFLLSSSDVTGEVINDGSGNDDVKTFVITGDHLRFFIDGVENPEIRVKQGDRVKIEFESTEGFHDWGIDEFNASTEKVNPGKPTSVEFVADKKGTFEYYCSVGQHRANGMAGKFIVE